MICTNEPHKFFNEKMKLRTTQSDAESARHKADSERVLLAHNIIKNCDLKTDDPSYDKALQAVWYALS